METPFWGYPILTTLDQTLPEGPVNFMGFGPKMAKKGVPKGVQKPTFLTLF